MTKEERAAADVAASYFVERTGKQLRPEQRNKLLEVIQNGIAATHVMDAVDAAISRHGLCGTERDYWETVLKECRKTWLKLYGKAAP